MTIRLPESLERSILEEVDNGHFASVDDAIAEAVRLLLQQGNRSEAKSDTPTTLEPTATAHKPIWEVADELRRSIPEEEWDKLPVDGASEHDHYIYGTPKRLAR
jgi:Arc/MetJ-type ribon-helix-helix transcriptional regulator